MKKTYLVLSLLLCFIALSCGAQKHVIWQVGAADNSPSGLALAPADYKRFLERDFGYEDRYYLVGHSRPERDFPYVLPGPHDGWGGTGPTSGIQSHVINILFGLDALPADKQGNLIIDIFDVDAEYPPLFKVEVNGQSWEFQLPPRQWR